MLNNEQNIYEIYAGAQTRIQLDISTVLAQRVNHKQFYFRAKWM